jgi:hypothetical protein
MVGVYHRDRAAVKGKFHKNSRNFLKMFLRNRLLSAAASTFENNSFKKCTLYADDCPGEKEIGQQKLLLTDPMSNTLFTSLR